MRIEEKSRNGRLSSRPAESSRAGDALPPRRLRHQRRRFGRIHKSLAIGGLLFGLTFLGALAWETYRIVAQNEPADVSTDTADEPVPQTASPAVLPAGAPSSQENNGENPLSAGTPPATAEPPQGTESPQEVSRQPGLQQQLSGEVASANRETSQTPAPTSANQPRVVRHVVKKGETLIQLSRKYYGHERGVNQIARYNGLDPQAILPIGKVLHIPLERR